MKRLAVVIPLVLLAACGGGSKDQVAGGTSKAAFLTKAEALCTKANADVAAQTFPTTPQGLPTYVQTLLDIANRTTKDVAALQPPAADKADLQAKVLTPLAAQVTEGRAYLVKVKAAVAANDQAELGRLISSPPSGSKADLAWMRSYGFKACVESASKRG